MAKAGAVNKITQGRVQEFREKLLGWYDRHGRELPWRYRRGQTPDPYFVWLSEIMLQQTTVTAVAPYFAKFITLWPDIHALAAAPSEDVMREWAGLGYYARARNLHACARLVSNDLNGQFPRTREGLLALPGIGDYTSAAISTIVYNQPETVVDGNVERVMARYFAIQEPLPQSKKKLKELAVPFFDGFTQRPGDLAQALMDLGATICIPKAPRCGLCPVAKQCRGRIEGIAAELPRKDKPVTRPRKYGSVYWIEDTKGKILLHRRPGKGLLGGMVALPTSDWTKNNKTAHPDFILPRTVRDMRRDPMNIQHTFTHFDLQLTLKTAKIRSKTPPGEGFFWAARNTLEEEGFPTVFRKALNVFLHE